MSGLTGSDLYLHKLPKLCPAALEPPAATGHTRLRTIITVTTDPDETGPASGSVDSFADFVASPPCGTCVLYSGNGVSAPAPGCQRHRQRSHGLGSMAEAAGPDPQLWLYPGPGLAPVLAYRRTRPQTARTPVPAAPRYRPVAV